jgi:DNA-binding transcriptional ArsR family regulator
MVGDLVDLLHMSQPGVSKHLRVLRDAGLVRVRQDAQRRWYELRPEPLAEVDSWLRTYHHLFNARLDRLDDYLRELQQKETEHDTNQ